MVECEVDEAGRDGDVCDVSDPELVGAVDLEVPGDIGIDRTVVIAVGGGDVAARPFSGSDRSPA
jgi:hypothetical protein